MPDTFLRRLDELPNQFTREEVMAAFDTLRESSITVYLSHLVKSGHLKRLGPKEFEKTIPPAEMPLDPISLQVATELKPVLMRSSFTRLLLWSSESLASFTHDAIMRPFAFVEAPQQTLPTIRDELQKNWNVVEFRRALPGGIDLWDVHRGRPNRRDLFLRPNIDLRGTVLTREGPRTPCLERLFVEVLQVIPDQVELLLNMVQARNFNADEAIRAAGARSNTAKVTSFLTWAAINHPHWEFAGALRQRFPHLRTEAST